ncbi:hypothetical protein F5144DRAFT_578125 [Chaetomium tenue]|uniref:Uncharacterized protein n=1 Tax=Chaetomium tenue TaxID=1854479 RepID=A0ACB7P2A3_9PEZI|nr:hypothetical protein F5144DRAFT_578125 [Chaetomium globosum]
MPRLHNGPGLPFLFLLRAAWAHIHSVFDRIHIHGADAIYLKTHGRSLNVLQEALPRTTLEISSDITSAHSQAAAPTYLGT